MPLSRLFILQITLLPFPVHATNTFSTLPRLRRECQTLQDGLGPASFIPFINIVNYTTIRHIMKCDLLGMSKSNSRVDRVNHWTVGSRGIVRVSSPPEGEQVAYCK